MARSLSQTLTLTRRFSRNATSSSSSSRLITLRAQSNLPSFHAEPAESSVDPLLRKLEDAIHRIIVRKSAPDWLPFAPGASYWVPPPRSRSHDIAQLVEKLANPLSEEETMSMTTVRGWPSSAYFIQGSSPQLMEAWNAEHKSGGNGNVDQMLDSTGHTSKPEEEEEG